MAFSQEAQSREAPADNVVRGYITQMLNEKGGAS